MRGINTTVIGEENRRITAMPFLHSRIWEITCQFNYYFTVKRVSQKQTKSLLMHIKAQKKKKKQANKINFRKRQNSQLWLLSKSYFNRHLYFTMISLSQFNDHKKILFKTASFADLKHFRRECLLSPINISLSLSIIALSVILITQEH